MSLPAVLPDRDLARPRSVLHGVMGLADSLVERDLGIDGTRGPFSMQPASAARRPAQIGLRFRAEH